MIRGGGNDYERKIQKLFEHSIGGIGNQMQAKLPSSVNTLEDVLSLLRRRNVVDQRVRTAVTNMILFGTTESPPRSRSSSATASSSHTQRLGQNLLSAIFSAPTATQDDTGK